MATLPIDSFSDHRPAGVFDVAFEGDGWEARGWVPSNLPVTIVVMDGDNEICRGDAAFDMGVELGAEQSAFRFTFAVPEAGVDRYSAYVAETGLEVPRRRDADD